MDGTDERTPFATDRETLEREAVLEFVKASGPGGQHRNKRETGVRLVHPPSGITVTAVERRSQAQNRDVAFERLAERLAALNVVERERVATAVPAGERRRRLESKVRHAGKKQLRRPPELPPDE